MANYRVEDIHNVALVGHEVAGKTSLADAILYKAKAVERRGCPEDGTSVSDFDDEEKKHKYSIDTSILHLDYQGRRINVLDTPGKPDFVGAALGALNAVETAIIVISAPAGVQVNTRRMFNEAGKRGLARMLVINRLDGDNIHFPELLQNIRETFGKNCVLFNAPLNPGHDFSGVVSVFSTDSTPPGCPIDVHAEHALLVDAIVEADEALMEKFLEQGNVGPEELAAALPIALAAGTLVPIFCTATKRDKDIGVAEVLDAIYNYAPSPVKGVKVKGIKGSGDAAEEIVIEPKEDGEFSALVFKTLSDKFVGHMSFFRVFSGTITSDTPLVNQRTGKVGKTNALLQIQGKTHKTVPEAIAGDIIAVAKVDDLHIGDTLGPVKIPMPSYPLPMFGLAVEPKSRGDEQKISMSLAKIADEDPTFKISRDGQTKELVITGMSQLHLDVVQRRLKNRFDLEILAHEPKIAYRETVTHEAEANYRHKKQSGGRGQFGEVHMRVYPLPREIHNSEQFFADFANKHKFEKIRIDHCVYEPDHNFGFIDTVVGGTIPNQYVPACEKGCRELLERGALAGFRIQDVAVEIYFGKEHAVDSSEAAFKTAARNAFKQGVLAAKPVLMEPVVSIEVTVPSKYTGAILGDLNTKRARIENQITLPGDLAVIMGKAPLSEMMRYAAQLGSITQGQGSYTMEFSHYDTVPANVQQQIVSKAKVHHDEDD